jgi:hypothetical protein
MKGGSQPHLIRCDDGCFYVVKFPNNPQGSRSLANELLGTKLALALGLPATQPEVIAVNEELIRNSPEMYIDWGSCRIPCAAGLQFGARFVSDPMLTPVFDFLPDSYLHTVVNPESFLGMLVFDKWSCNTDSRQAVFHLPGETVFDRATGPSYKRYWATMMDQGYCFNASSWNFMDTPIQGLYSRHCVYAAVQGLDAFAPFLRRLENLPDRVLWEAAESVPPEWYGGRKDEMWGLVDQLAARRKSIASLILSCVASAPNAFPIWEPSCAKIGSKRIKPLPLIAPAFSHFKRKHA